MEFQQNSLEILLPNVSALWIGVNCHTVLCLGFISSRTPESRSASSHIFELPDDARSVSFSASNNAIQTSI